LARTLQRQTSASRSRFVVGIAISMPVFHTAKFANGQAFTGGLQRFVAHVFVFARLAALGCGGVCSGNGAVLGYVLLGLGITLFCY